MGVRGELFTTKIALQNRTYFFNVKENRLGDYYLNIVESKNRDEGGFDRQSVILFAEDLEEFLRGFDESLRVLEKAAREKRRLSSGRRESAHKTESEDPPARRPRERPLNRDRQDQGKPRQDYRERQEPGRPRQDYRERQEQSRPRQDTGRSRPAKSAGRENTQGRRNDGSSPPRKKRVVIKRSKK